MHLTHSTSYVDAFDTLYQLCRCIWDAPDFNWSQVSHRILLHPALYQTTPFTTSDSSSLSSTSIHPAIHPSPSIHPSQFLSPTLNSVYISLSQISALNCNSNAIATHCSALFTVDPIWLQVLVEFIFKSKAADELHMMMILNHFGFRWPVKQK